MLATSSHYFVPLPSTQKVKFDIAMCTNVPPLDAPIPPPKEGSDCQSCCWTNWQSLYLHCWWDNHLKCWWNNHLESSLVNRWEIAPKVHSLINFVMLHELHAFLDGVDRHLYMLIFRAKVYVHHVLCPKIFNFFLFLATLV